MTQAAAQLSLTQSALSHQIREAADSPAWRMATALRRWCESDRAASGLGSLEAA